jgi:hypothetical protein
MYGFPLIIADFFSRTVCLQRSIDPSITEYIVETKDVNGYFALFESLLEGSPIRVTGANRRFLLSLSHEFGNFDISISIMKHFGTYYPLSQLYDYFGEGSIPFLASSFHELNSSDLDNIPVSALYDILSHDDLRITSEDSLYFYVSSHFDSDPEYFNLLQFVQFSYLSPEYISECFLLIPNSIDRHLWAAISPRLISFVEITNGEFPLKDPNSLDGIISYLTRKYSGNVHDEGIVTITSKSVRSGCPVRNLANLASQERFASMGCSNEWVCWDFGEMRLRPTH